MNYCQPQSNRRSDWFAKVEHGSPPVSRYGHGGNPVAQQVCHVTDVIGTAQDKIIRYIAQHPSEDL